MITSQVCLWSGGTCHFNGTVLLGGLHPDELLAARSGWHFYSDFPCWRASLLPDLVLSLSPFPLKSAIAFRQSAQINSMHVCKNLKDMTYPFSRAAASSLPMEGGVRSACLAPYASASPRLSSRTSVMAILDAPKAFDATRAFRPAYSVRHKQVI